MNVFVTKQYVFLSLNHRKMRASVCKLLTMTVYPVYPELFEVDSAPDVS